MQRSCLAVLTVASIFLGAGTARALTPTCNELTGEKRKLAAEILKGQHLYDCCDRTIAECLRKKRVCPLAVRLANNVCRRVAAGQDKKSITRSLSRRAKTIFGLGSKPAKIDLTDLPAAGDPRAPITLVEYGSARGEHCLRMTPPVYDAVVNGPLKGKVKLYFKAFPLRGNKYAKEAGAAYMASLIMGKFWEYVLHSYAHFHEFTPDRRVEWAAAVGMNRKLFSAWLIDPRMMERLLASKKEGLENGVETTPTFFIDGHRYHGDNDVEELTDVLLEIYEKRQRKSSPK
jgi:hypothetical protein